MVSSHEHDFFTCSCFPTYLVINGNTFSRYEQFSLVEALNGTLPQTPGNSSNLDEIHTVDEDIVRASMNKGRGLKVKAVSVLSVGSEIREWSLKQKFQQINF